MQNPTSEAIAAKFIILRPLLDERARRAWAAVEARAMGRGGMSRVAEATGLSRGTIRAGLQDLASADMAAGPQAAPERLRRRGGGRKPLSLHDPHLLHALETLVDPVTRGDRMSLLRWTCKSAAQLAAALRAQGHLVRARTVNRLLHDLGYSLVVYLSPAAKYFRPLPSPLRDVNQRVMNACIGFSGPRSALF